jgi:hypothetical protein
MSLTGPIRYLLAFLMLVGAAVTLVLAREAASVAGIRLGAIPTVLIVAPWLYGLHRLLNRSGTSEASRLSDEEVISRLKAAASNPHLSTNMREEAQRRLDALGVSNRDSGQDTPL